MESNATENPPSMEIESPRVGYLHLERDETSNQSDHFNHLAMFIETIVHVEGFSKP